VRLRPASPAGSLSAVVLAAGALAAGALNGCGGSSSGNGVASKTPAEIVASAKALADAASAVHVSGSIVAGGTKIALDLHLVTGRGGRGQLSENGLSFELIQIHGTAFIKGSPAFYTHFAGAAAAQLLQGRWLKAPATTGPLAALAALTNARALLDAALAEHAALTKGARTTVNGQQAIAVTDSSKGGTLYVATTGPPYPIELTKTGAGGGSIIFDRWNQPVSVAPPVSAIDITQLQQKH
jgi:hypothetical protein